MNNLAALPFRPVKAFTTSLPIFRQDRPEDAQCLFYTPGRLVRVSLPEGDAFEAALAGPGQTALPGWGEKVTQLRLAAAGAQNAYRHWISRPFSPQCLTLYMNNNCPLECSYCYSQPSRRGGPRLGLPAIRAAARLVADNCRKQGNAFTLVFHGGGEPVLDAHTIDQALDYVQTLARENGLELFTYIATNGVISQAKARWLAGRFSLVGLSCDGPAHFHDAHRRLRSGGGTAQYVERTARILREAGQPFHVRVTLTPDSFAFQAEVAQYICTRLRPQEAHVEPVYRAGRASETDLLAEEQVETYIRAFLSARRTAAGYGVPWLTSASRPGEIHGPYCNVFRDVLNLTPDGVASACFLGDGRGQAIGRYDEIKEVYLLNEAAIQSQQERLGQIPQACQSCFNQYHCTHGCPEGCGLMDEKNEYNFRCSLAKRLAEEEIIGLA